MDSVQKCPLFADTSFTKTFQNEELSVEWKSRDSVKNNRRKKRESRRKILQENPGFEVPKTGGEVMFTCTYNIDAQELKIKFDTYETKTN